jgi:aspartate aminotransferase
MLERLDRVPDDSILGLMAAFRADSAPNKVDLGVGVYRDARGETPVLDAVRRAERAVLDRQATKSYVAPAGNAGFNQAMERLVFGPEHPVLAAGRVRSIQGTGGCGALRLGAELIRSAAPHSLVYISNPSWANHVPLIGGAGLKLERYPYYDAATGAVRLTAMLEVFDSLPAGTVVLLHASCHNPTGADLAEDEWRQLLEVVKRRRLMPFIDMAYQGLGTGIDADAFAIRLFAAQLPEMLVAVSCSKNFGLYRERTGVLHMVTETPVTGVAALSHEVRIARTLYSMPPDHGAAIVNEILGDGTLRSAWEGELAAMRARLTGLRRELVRELAVACPQRDFGFIGAQHGLFSLLGLGVDQVTRLRTEHHIYMTDDSRINVAGLRTENLAYFVQSLAHVVANRA